MYYDYLFLYLFFRFNFVINWSTTVFILNLAFNDVLYCACNFTFFVIMFVHKRFDWGVELCILDGNIRYSNALGKQAGFSVFTPLKDFVMFAISMNIFNAIVGISSFNF